MAFQLQFLKYYAWGVSQFLIGADKGKQQLHFETLRPPPGAKILDVGCATGNASEAFSSPLFFPTFASIGTSFAHDPLLFMALGYTAAI